ncbi:MAG TPA: glycoside hydrolase family 2 TIM barrel-domain containing protein, partial [Pyrinomonadaceae bacterium]|nr:glycoside hydrolase family 2 TIM barrel-domain containing protein [Pyrinomonadaceae bacterium]
MNDPKLNRRNFLKTSVAGAAGLSLLANSNAEAAPPEVSLTLPDSISERRIIPLNHEWLYSEKSSAEAMQVNFNDKSFARVTIPHTNKILPVSGFAEQEYMFVSAYRRHFKLPKELKGQRIFVDFGGVMTAAKVFINGKNLGEYKGGYTPFSFELTNDINWAGDNVLAVEVDSTERKDIPPFGGMIDYLTFGGIYRDVQIRAVADTFIANVFAKPVNVLQSDRSVNVSVFVAGKTERDLQLNAELRDGSKVLATGKRNVVGTETQDIVLSNLGQVELWDIQKPKLYDVRVTITSGSTVVDHYETLFGFREAKFTPEGFYLNGKALKLRGLNRHQTYPFVGQAMPERVQKRDAWILKNELKCNIVRTSHYPQSPHFLDACDEYGLLVFEEIPGWQHVGDKAWQDLTVQHVGEMIHRDWNHPSIILWGVRVNESGDYHDFYTETNKLSHDLDDSRQTGGVRYRYPSERLEDVFTMNDFGWPLRAPNHPLYLNTEFSGHMFPTKQFDNGERLREHTHRHARVHDALAADVKYAGGIGWCAFDYNTHDYFGSGDRICYHGVTDIFRIPKPAAGFYRSQCEPSEEIVLEPAFHWACGDENEAFTFGLVSSNCEKLKYFVGDKLVAEADPDRKTYPNLTYAPFNPNLRSSIWGGVKWDDLRIEGWIGGKKVIERKMSGKGVDREFVIKADDTELKADGIDMTRLVFKVTDEFGNLRPYAVGAIQFTIENGEIIGDN